MIPEPYVARVGVFSTYTGEYVEGTQEELVMREQNGQSAGRSAGRSPNISLTCLSGESDE